MKQVRTWRLVTVATLAAAAAAQDPVGGEVSRQLEALQRQNAALEERLNTIESHQFEGDSGDSLFGPDGAVVATLKLFGDVGFRYHDPTPTGQEHTQFFLGSLGFVANAQLGDHFRVLSESVIADRGGPGGAISVDQERLWAMWTINDAIYVKMGTEHSPVSRWNQLYHHGRWLETAISRPLLAAFEGGGGILAMHTTGIELGGRLQADASDFEWFLSVANGRGMNPTEKRRSSDSNEGKKLDAGLAFLPTAVPDLRIGTSFTDDEIPADPTSELPGRARSIREFVATANVQYRNGPFELLGEFGWVEHEIRASQTSFHHDSGYLQLAYRAGEVTPYARMDYRRMDRMDPFYSDFNRDLDILRPIVGLRYDPSDNLAVKLEFSYGQAEQRLGTMVRDRDIVSVAFQVSWVL